MTREQRKQALIASGALVTTGLGVVIATGLTTTVAGTTAAAGAIATKTTMTSAGPMVLSTVKASVGAKILCIGLVALATYMVVDKIIEYYDNKETNNH